MFNSSSVGSSGPEDGFEDDSYSPCSLSSSSSTHTVSLEENVTCTSCGQEILDRYLLKVSNLCWHVRCLSCCVCKTSLGRHVSCFIREQQVFCKLDYFRKYGTRCARCGRNIQANDWVRRARGSTFHLACFSCKSCKRQLSTGEECGLLENRIYCRRHYDLMVENIKRSKENESKTEEEMSKESSCTMPKPAKRVRTSFSVDQLQIMQSQFAKDNNPDAQTLQALSDRTGLTRRVIQVCILNILLISRFENLQMHFFFNPLQVWFQNCRARQKKHIIPNPPPATIMTSLPPDHSSAPLMEDLHYTNYISQDVPLLTTFTYMDVQNPDTLLLQPLMSQPLGQLPASHA
ncbi:LIM/homeobox protein Lhx8-like isoform X2 [Synchiropus splendidus]|uniref:LIM/homeobox protein Lhx8-like isoform X2 n=1 Tax=Synchiropus splendidus TaxID=270530 RepID=UPI00237EE062|nr:LIM/homeobox protein Lhx8-like isoform X2 [Synchiropus splendidus]